MYVHTAMCIYHNVMYIYIHVYVCARCYSTNGCCSFFKDGMQTINHFNSYVTSMVPKLRDLKSKQDTERKQLVELKESLKTALATYKEVNVAAASII